MATTKETAAQGGNAVEQAKSAAQKAKEALMAKAQQNGADAAKVEQLAAVAPAAKAAGKQRAEGEKSAKAKESLGVPEEHVITWLHFHCTEEDSEMLKKAAKQRNTKVANMLVKILLDKLEGETMEELRADAKLWDDAHPASGRSAKSLESMTAEQLEAEQKKLEARIAKMNEMLAKAKAKVQPAS